MEKLWTKSFIQLTLGMLVLFTGFYLLLPTMPLFIKEMGGTESQIGLAAGAFTLTAVVFRPLVGGLLDRYGRRSFMIWGLLFFILCMYLYEWVAGIAILLVLRALHGATWAFSTTAVSTSVTDMIPVSRRGEGMGWFGMAMTVAMAIGPMLGLWMLQSASFQGLFLLATGLSAAALLLVFRVRVPFQPASPARKIQIFERSVLPVASSLFFLAVAYGGITTFLPLFAESIRVNSGTFFLIYALALTLIRPLAGKLSDRFGEAYVILPSLVITIASLLVLSFSTGLGGVILAAVLYGIGFGSAQPALQAANLRLAPPDKRGVANATYLTAFDLGIGLGAIMLGWVSQYSGYELLFTVCAVSVAVSALVFVSFARRPLREKEARAL
ncbi:Predicted arabinose efflux permease, MFS family [Paenibacillus sp. UNCCL117]|uniref:MFS transporter n=1 Tax=unclassified Paenibacillus TaxID=185978 RepID=UPI0008880F98|nr:MULTISPECIES: MFS transporter [unclassified Paenibacillus]SDD76159.1 Predicted arabinose efflux permease, MFS family [Paenibacillus sp. cl123]SFW52362.1 Predicted arabinose efflux permease, MFS family [Paenibacillus sp. UNCCL117]